jgi:hypothetical protein
MKDTDFDHVSDNGIESQKINEIMAEYHIKYYAIILDCCHAGMHSLGSNDEPVYSISISDYTDSKGAFFIPTIEASRSVQTMDFGGKNYVPFSFYFFKTLQEGIINEYKRISFKELYDIVKQRLEEIDIKLPPVDQKGELYNVAIWENLKYRNVGNGYISDEEENLQRIKEFKVKEQFADLYGALKDVLDFINMLEVLIAYPDSMQDDRHKRFNELKNNIMSVIFAAGSKEAVELMSYIREAIYEGLDDGKTISTRLLIAAHILLAMQLKYDVTGIETSPKEWYAGKYTTQKMEKTNFYNEAKEINNNIVDKLRLESFLRIED